MTSTWLLTGATGFVGRHVVRALVGQGIRLKVVLRTECDLTDTWPSGTEIVRSDDLFSETAEWWAKVAEGVDTVLHLAWYAEPGLYLQSVKNLDCLAGTLAMAKGCAKAGIRRFIGVGTCFEYDVAAGYLSIHTPLKPLSPYAAAKAAAYLALSEFFKQTQTSFAWCRLFYLYGEGEDPRRLIAYVKTQLQKGLPVELTSGQQVRDYMDVSEAATQLIATALGSSTGPVNVCSGQAVTVRALVERLALEHGRTDLLRFGVRPDNFTDPLIVVGIKD